MGRVLTIAVVVFLLSLDCDLSISATLLFFPDKKFESLDELDRALEVGEISQEDYDILVEAFLWGLDPEIELDSNLLSTTAIPDNPGSAKRKSIKYGTVYTQRLDGDNRFTRYDRLRVASSHIDLAIGVEKRSNAETLVRTRLIKVRDEQFTLTAGNFDVVFGRGLTVGRSNYRTIFARKDKFSASLVQPVKARRNGVLAEYKSEDVSINLFGSRMEGDSLYDQVVGGDASKEWRRNKVGVAGMSQLIGKFGSGRRASHYLAPHFELLLGIVSLKGESSIGINSASADVLELERQTGTLSQSFTFFRYGDNYQNLESGGYAYSDYSDNEVDEVGFAYRDKRGGRVGAGVSTKLTASKNQRWGFDLVRWDDHLDHRKCVAARFVMDSKKLLGLKLPFKLAGVLEEFDLEKNSKSRRFVSCSNNLPISQGINCETMLRFENRLSSGIEKHPLRVRVDLHFDASNHFSSNLIANYYDPNSMVGSDQYLTLGIEEKLSRKGELTLTARIQSKYLFSERSFSNSEVRINCEIGVS